MKIGKIDNMTRGWFIGNFEPSVLKTNDVEVAVKKYKAGAYEKAHYHKIATEITVIYKGIVKMFDKEWGEGTILTVEPNDITDFTALTDVTTFVVKIPGANDDKYIVEE